VTLPLVASKERLGSEALLGKMKPKGHDHHRILMNDVMVIIDVFWLGAACPPVARW